jgi:2'-hydroxyisoflavone reductase
LLADSVGCYVFVSSISVYRDLNQPDINEEYPLATLSDETVEDVGDDTYGGLKALCERAVQQVYGERALVIRPGLIVGPHDPTNRFTYWVTRAAQGGEVLAPIGPHYAVQVIDVHDLAEWTVRMAEAEASGVFNATGPDYPLTLGAILQTATDTTASDARFVWASEEFLLANDVTPWSELPLWERSDVKVHYVSSTRALAAGLTFRPLKITVRDTLDWARSLPPADPRPAGLTLRRERQLLSAWRSHAV